VDNARARSWREMIFETDWVLLKECVEDASQFAAS
jgi:hypothetical protein